MSHECPECGQICYCGGDIDDAYMETTETYVNCVHYLKPECDYNLRDADIKFMGGE